MNILKFLFYMLLGRSIQRYLVMIMLLLLAIILFNSCGKYVRFGDHWGKSYQGKGNNHEKQKYHTREAKQVRLY